MEFDRTKRSSRLRLHGLPIRGLHAFEIGPGEWIGRIEGTHGPEEAVRAESRADCEHKLTERASELLLEHMAWMAEIAEELRALC